MSNVNHPNAWHGLDDEPGDGPGGRCLQCWREAKRAFFAKHYHPRGETLQKTYLAIHYDNHM